MSLWQNAFTMPLSHAICKCFTDISRIWKSIDDRMLWVAVFNPRKIWLCVKWKECNRQRYMSFVGSEVECWIGQWISGVAWGCCLLKDKKRLFLSLVLDNTNSIIPTRIVLLDEVKRIIWCYRQTAISTLAISKMGTDIVSESKHWAPLAADERS